MHSCVTWRNNAFELNSASRLGHKSNTNSWNALTSALGERMITRTDFWVIFSIKTWQNFTYASTLSLQRMHRRSTKKVCPKKKIQKVPFLRCQVWFFCVEQSIKFYGRVYTCNISPQVHAWSSRMYLSSRNRWMKSDMTKTFTMGRNRRQNPWLLSLRRQK